MIDVHCHLLHGIDDGPASIEGAVALARALIEVGVQRVVATPHVSRTFPNDAQMIEARHSELVGRLTEEEVDLRVDTGAEIAVTMAMGLSDDQLRALALNRGEWLLLEPPTSVDAMGIQSLLLDVQRRGFRIVLAHPERVSAFRREPVVLETIARSGIRLQVTASALTGQFGRSTSRFARKLVEMGIVHMVASDAHGTAGRGPGLADELRISGFAGLEERLCVEGPLEVVGG